MSVQTGLYSMSQCRELLPPELNRVALGRRSIDESYGKQVRALLPLFCHNAKIEWNPLVHISDASTFANFPQDGEVDAFQFYRHALKS